MRTKQDYSLITCVFFIFILVFNLHEKTFSQCNTPGTGGASNVTTTTADPGYSCCQQGTYYLEYGLTGFTPGTTNTPGTGGTLVTVPSNPALYTITGLTPATTYDYYIRIYCNTGNWTANSTVKQFSTIPDCNTTPLISCGSIVSLNMVTAQGGWSIGGGNCNSGYGKESIYRFTASYSGNHILVSHGVNNQNGSSFYYKPQSSGCNSTGWTCIGNGWPGVNQVSFGPLTAGTTYYILSDPYIATIAPSTDKFMIECPTCPAPTNVTTIANGPTAIKISWTGSAYWIEYGPEGFMPGSGAGTTNWVGPTATTYSIAGLTPSTSYDVYLRADCGGSYSPRSLKLWTSTTACPSPIVYPSLGTSVGAMGGIGSNDYYPGTNCYNITEGTENYVSFTPPVSGYYDVIVYHPYYYGVYNFLSRPANAICDLSGYACNNPLITEDSYDLIRWGPLTAGTSYDVLFDTEDTSYMSWDYSFGINCPKPDSVNAFDIRPNSIRFSWSSNCPNTTHIEYGPPGFTPGTGDVAGTNGTVVPNVSTPYNVTGLVADTKYDVYIRSNCGGQFSANSSKISVQTAVKCSDAPVVSCGDYLQFCTDGFTAIDGAWAPTFCGNSNNQSKEGIWRFTPSQTGTYSIFVYHFSANSIYYTYSANFYIKQASLGCNEQNWNCAGSVAGSIYYGFNPVTLSLGTLNAGTAYYILADGMQISFTAGYCYSFRIDCFNVCPQPILSYVNNLNLTGATINAVCDSCQGDIKLEYGPSGFTPGTNATPGVGGTVISNVYFPYALSGLTTGTAYDVYIRRNCGAPNGFSVNSAKLFFTPCSVAPTAIATDAVDNIFCVGDSVTLSQVGGVLAPGGAYKWYSSYCGNSLVGTGSSIKVAPATTAYYYMRAEAGCGNSPCRSITLYPTSTGPAATVTAAGPVTFCSGDSVRLNANTGAGLTYKWKKNGTNIPGATASFYYAKTTGAYSVKVTNPCSSLTSSQLAVNVNALPSVVITPGSPTSFCSGGSVNLSVASGANKTYQWIKGGTAIPGATLSSYIATTGGNYKVTVTNSVTGCSDTTATSTVVTVNQQPSATITPQGPTTFCAGGSVLLKGNSGTGLTYKWKKNTVFISGATNKNYTATTAGTYKLQVTNSNGCSKTSAGVVVSVPCRDNSYAAEEDIPGDHATDFIVFPNPSTGAFTIQFAKAPSEPIRIYIEDVMGKVVEIPETKEKTVLIDRPDLAPGIYFISVKNATGILVKKISIEKF